MSEEYLTGPEVRVEMKVLADQLRAGWITPKLASEQLRELIPHLCRRKAIKNGKAKAHRITPEMKAAVKAYWREHPDELNRDIGLRFGIDGAGYRKSWRGSDD